MNKSIPQLGDLLDRLRQRTHALGLTDAAWAARAGIRHETLSRLRRRSSCDFATLQALARAAGAAIGLIEIQTPAVTADGRYPVTLDRDYEDSLVDLCAAGDCDAARWRSVGPPFFMAGLAVMLACLPEFDRPTLLRLAEALHAGSTQVDVFAIWLKGSPVRPSRFLPMVSGRMRHAA